MERPHAIHNRTRRGRALAMQAALVLLLSICPAGAEVTISLPLHGFFRAGRYMPVRVTGAAAAQRVIVTADEAIPTEISISAGADVVAPWLVMRPPLRAPVYGASGNPPATLSQSLHGLGDDERLLGVCGVDAAAGATLFPGKTVISVSLDAEPSLLSPAMAWESLDGVVLDEVAAGRVQESQLATLLAMGMTVAVKSNARPSGQWPWVRVGELWVVHYEPLGPAAGVVPDAYIPTYGWMRGWPTEFRRVIVLGLLVFCFLAAGAGLWHGWVAVSAVTAIATAASAGLGFWSERQSPVLEQDAVVSVTGGPITQTDFWSWQASLRQSASSLAVQNLHPIFASDAQIGSMNLRLVSPEPPQAGRFQFQLEPGMCIGFLDRVVSVGAPQTSPLKPATSPLADMARRLYLGPAERLVGQGEGFAGAEGSPVPIVVISRDGAQ